jgi:hypothetical protein
VTASPSSPSRRLAHGDRFDDFVTHGICDEFGDLIVRQSSFTIESADDGDVFEPEILSLKEPGHLLARREGVEPLTSDP